MSEKRARDPVEGSNNNATAEVFKKPRLEPQRQEQQVEKQDSGEMVSTTDFEPYPSKSGRLVHFMTLWEDPNMSVYSFYRDSTPESDVIYSELMKLWRLDDTDMDEKNYPKLRLNSAIVHFVEYGLIRKMPSDLTPEGLASLPPVLLAVKDWGTWGYSDNPFRKAFHGECVLFHSWC